MSVEDEVRAAVAKVQAELQAEREEKKRNGPRYVYFVQADTLRLVKIGVAVDLSNRLSALRTGNADTLTVLGVIPDDDARTLERALHHEFRAHWHHGEWFSPCVALLDFIAEHAVSEKRARQMRMEALAAKVQQAA